MGSPNDISTGSGNAKIKILNVNDFPQSIKIFTPHNKEVLRIEPQGRIVWFFNDKEIVVKEKSVLAIALFDVFIKLMPGPHDYSKLDPELYKQYQEFLNTKTKGGEE